MTAPLRQLLIKDATYRWYKECEDSFQALLRMINSRTYLAPHDPRRKTHLVMDASLCEVATSLYQEDDQGKWVPTDHTSRVLSPYEQGSESQIDWESLAKVWGMMFRPYLIGVHFMSWGDHKPLLLLFNEMSKAMPVRSARHRNKVQDLRFNDKYLPGKSMPCNYASRHASPIKDLTEEEKERLMVDVGEDIQVIRVIMADLPPALTMEVLKEVAKCDNVYQTLKAAVKEGKKPKDRDQVPYMAVWEELAVIEELVCRGERIVMPEGRSSTNDVALREWVVDLGHSSHQGVDATKRKLRVWLWFPDMDRAVERRVSSCLACQASVESKARDPLKPTKAPEEPWSRLYAHHWGPKQDGYHILVIIDGLTRYPEVSVVKNTSAKNTIQAFSKVLSRHGVPRRLHSDNGTPFNGKDSHLLQKYFTNMGIKHVTNKSAEDPEATGLVMAFMRHLKTIFHSAGVEREDPYLRLNNYLMQFRATPNATMRKCPAELLFKRKFVTKLPYQRQQSSDVTTTHKPCCLTL